MERSTNAKASLWNTLGDRRWSPRVTVVDANEDRRQRFVSKLRSQGCAVQHFASDDGALKLLEFLHISQAPDLLVVHQEFARGGISSLASRVRKIEACASTVVYIYSCGLGEDSTKVEERLRSSVDRLYTSRRLLEASRLLQGSKERLRQSSRPSTVPVSRRKDPES